MGVPGDGGLCSVTDSSGCACTCRQNRNIRRVTQPNSAGVLRLGVEVGVRLSTDNVTCRILLLTGFIQNIVGSRLSTNTRTATAASEGNHGAIDDQSGGATTGTTVDVTLHIGAAGPLSINARLCVRGDGVNIHVTTVTVALTTGCRTGTPNLVTLLFRSLRIVLCTIHALQVSYTTGSCDQLDNLAFLDGDFTHNESTGTTSNRRRTATCTTGNLEANLVNLSGNGELLSVLSAGRLTRDVELGSRCVRALSGGCKSGNCSRCCNNRSSPCCASYNLAARNVSRHVCPSRVISWALTLTKNAADKSTQGRHTKSEDSVQKRVNA